MELEHTHGYDVQVTWEHEFTAQLRADPHLRAMYNEIFIAGSMDPRRDAYRGGRVEPWRFHHLCAEDEEIICLDVVSS